ncbi:MAG: DUF4465 domain-containing protein [Bacteroidales bacterium]|nr:DUF4465 domain-containing protein [Bacteroidales bacterium]
MKKTLLTLAAFAAIIVSCTPDEIPAVYETKTIDFEGAAFSALIDTPQYFGPLLYSENEYSWSDGIISHSNNKADWGEYGGWAWDSGAAISNYTSKTYGDYNIQLSVATDAAAGGHDGSSNFAVWFGHDWGTGGLPEFKVKSDERVNLKEMYVNNTAYGLSNCYDDEGNCIITDGQEIHVELTATLERDIPMDGGQNIATKKVSFKLVDGPSKIVKDWALWDLSEVYMDGFHLVSFSFNVDGNIEDSYGFYFPSYFAFDDLSYEVLVK